MRGQCARNILKGIETQPSRGKVQICDGFDPGFYETVEALRHGDGTFSSFTSIVSQYDDMLNL